jgi:hypothetical protein
VDALVERNHPLIWSFEDYKRVLDPDMSKGDQALLLLHANPSWLPEKDLLNWVEYSNPTVFRRDVLWFETRRATSTEAPGSEAITAME